MKKSVLFICSAIAIASVLAGCGREPEGEAVARINGHPITVEDFTRRKEQLKPFFMSPDPEQNNERVMDLLVDDVLLLLEADRLDINRDRDFLRSIEHFWRQSLVQELLKKKTREIRNDIHIAENELRDFYSALSEEYYFRHIAVKNEGKVSFPEVSKIDSFVKKNAKNVLQDSGWNWADIRTIDPRFRPALLDTPVSLNQWILGEGREEMHALIITRKRKNPVGSFETLKEEIRELLLEAQEQKRIEAWIENLRKQASIRVDREKLSHIQ
jgi:hypothetical protein